MFSISIYAAAAHVVIRLIQVRLTAACVGVSPVWRLSLPCLLLPCNEYRGLQINILTVNSTFYKLKILGIQLSNII